MINDIQIQEEDNGVAITAFVNESTAFYGLYNIDEKTWNNSKEIKGTEEEIRKAFNL